MPDQPPACWIAQNALAFAVRAPYPVSDGHCLVFPLRWISALDQATPAERAAIFAIIEELKARLLKEDPALSFTVAASLDPDPGPIASHAHIHLIPHQIAAPTPSPLGQDTRAANADDPLLPRRANPLTDGQSRNALLPALRSILDRAARVDIVAAFTRDSGVDLMEDPLRAALRRGGQVRLLTGDYLNLTSPRALSRLLDLSRSLEAGADEGDSEGAGEPLPGRLETRVVETARIRRSFHPKAWVVEGPGFGVAYVGSSNLSRSALLDGVEWNLRVDRARDPQAWARIGAAFDALWTEALPIDEGWIATYACRPRPTLGKGPDGMPPGADLDEEPPRLRPPVTPNAVQVEALAALAQSRAAGVGHALVVLATGLGKTWLAAFDLLAIEKELGRPLRVLVLAHLRELLEQAAGTLRACGFEAGVAWLGDGKRPTGDWRLLFASVQTLSRPEHLHGFRPDDFDCVVVDEVHHAAARSYRRILDHLRPRFLLGLTATPERADDGDVAALFDDNLVYRCDLGLGIARGLLVPFRYFGLKDTVDYANLPWKNGRFDVAELSRRVETQARMETLWRAWTDPAQAGQRSLVFCVSIAHAEFTRDWLKAQGVRVEAVHSGAGSHDRGAGLEALAAGRLDALCAVDLFNEGIDCPSIDRVVLLRPTESPVVFLQQLGRGLRTLAGKSILTVIDFVGNHRVFLNRLRTVLGLGGGVGEGAGGLSTPLHAFLYENRAATLPPGCSVHIDLEAIDLLRFFLPQAGADELERVYRELRVARDDRPTPGELLRRGLNPATVRRGYGSWFHFVEGMGDLSEPEKAVLAAAGAWLAEVEAAPFRGPFRPLVLEQLFEGEHTRSAVPLDRLIEGLRRRLQSDVRLQSLLSEAERRALDSPEAWRAAFDRRPRAEWSGGLRIDTHGVTVQVRLPEERDRTFIAMARELVDLRLAQLRRRLSFDPSTGAVEIKIIHNSQGPILKLPDGRAREALPVGWTDVRLPDGEVWHFNFVSIAVNVARRPGRDQNLLPALLRGWFGEAASRSGTSFRVRLSPSPDGWWMEPVRAEGIELPARGRVRAWPSLRAAAGRQNAAQAELEAEWVSLPGVRPDPELFAVRAAGDSMDGGKNPIRDGDWVLLRWARGQGFAALEGQVALVAVGEASEDAHEHYLKRLVHREGDWVLRSDNPEVSDRPAAGAEPLARFLRVCSPESLAPEEGRVFDRGALVEAFGLSASPRPGASRVDGHLFLLLSEPGQLPAPDRALPLGDVRRPAETAFICTPVAGSPDTWRYAGVGRWLATEGRWGFTALDLQSWRAFSSARGASRTLREEDLGRARRAVARLLAEGAGRFVEARGKRCRLLGQAAQGGLRIDGGEGGFEARTISLVDLAWVLRAKDDVAARGGTLDEPRVNRVRFLEGVGKGSTRYIDTGWALALLEGLDGA